MRNWEGMSEGKPSTQPPVHSTEVVGTARRKGHPSKRGRPVIGRVAASTLRIGDGAPAAVSSGEGGEPSSHFYRASDKIYREESWTTPTSWRAHMRAPGEWTGELPAD